MSLQLAAKHLAQQGRGNDTALVHMAPKELASLQALAQKHGGSLSINPQTGLPEAGFLESLLPAVVGGGLSIMSGGAVDPMTAGMLVGGGQALLTGDLNKGLMAGLGAYGGAGMGSYMANAGSVMPAAAAKETVSIPTAAEIAPARAIDTNVESALGTGGIRPEDVAYGQNGPTGFQFSNNVGNVERDIAGGNDLMRTNSSVDAYMRKNMPIGEDTYPAYRAQTPANIGNAPGGSYPPTVANVDQTLERGLSNYNPATPYQTGNYPGGSTAPTVTNTPKDFAAFQRGFTMDNALGFAKSSPLQAAALAAGPLMDATTRPPPAAVVDSNKGANANAGIKYRPNWASPIPTPNRYGIEQVYNRPAYMAEGGEVKHYDSGGLTPALQMFYELQNQRMRQQDANRQAQIDTKQQFNDYMNSVRGGTAKPILPTTPTAPNTPTAQPAAGAMMDQTPYGGRGSSGPGEDPNPEWTAMSQDEKDAYNAAHPHPIGDFFGSMASLIVPGGIAKSIFNKFMPTPVDVTPPAYTYYAGTEFDPNAMGSGYTKGIPDLKNPIPTPTITAAPEGTPNAGPVPQGDPAQQKQAVINSLVADSNAAAAAGEGGSGTGGYSAAQQAADRNADRDSNPGEGGAGAGGKKGGLSSLHGFKRMASGGKNTSLRSTVGTMRGVERLMDYADGGSIYNLGSYSDGGRLLKGPGDGVSDSIPATIGKGQPARLADGEFVIPARIVSEIGNGSTDAGARKLYAMMDRIQSARGKTVGKGKVAKNTRADKYLPG